ncbi:S8 family serine peptidase [Litorivita pollutaquae]|nr:S8 family serine peptidase [Litorivita pollutaquae]
MQPNDSLYAFQWHFTLIGDVETIWDEYTGAGIAVGVYDTGVDILHSEFDENYNSALHFPGDDGEPNGAANSHGTSVAGIIAAENDGSGVVGVAFDASLTSVDFLVDVSLADTFDAYDWMANFDVVNNSWGYTPNFGDDNDVGDVDGYTYAEVEHIGVATATGRGGLGTIVTKAAGNENHNSTLEATGIMGNAQGDGINNTRYAISVAATGSDGIIADYSNWGTNVLIAAPAAQYTTDRVGPNGYNGTDYTSTFGGTSAATPVISGVAALMLDANAGLGWRDVQEIFSVSAAHTGSSYGAAATSYEEGAWFANGADDWNGGGRTYNVSYGFGMVDAYAAVRMAEVWSLFGNAQTSGNEVQSTLSYSGSSMAISDHEITSVSQVSSAGMVVEHIAATIELTHFNMSDIQVTLVGPDGSRYVLLNHDGGDEMLVGDYTYGVDLARGSYSDGEWAVEVEDTSTGDTGWLYDFDLTFYGRAVSDDKVYHFTDDYLDFRADEEARGSITVAASGEQWVNLAALTGDVSFHATGTSAFRVDNVIWASFANADVIEGLVAGDGDDTLTGNALENHILGMRGNDSLEGGAGRDTLEGGAGDDVIDGGTWADTIRAGAGTDTVYGGMGKDTIWLDEGNDVFFDDVQEGVQGADTVYAGDGNDSLYGGGGDDYLAGGTGDDSVTGGVGNDTLIGAPGDDTLRGADGHDSIHGGKGADLIDGGWRGDTLIGAGGNDTLHGRQGYDQLFGGGNNDLVLGEQGNDTAYGGNGNDTLYGALDDDWLYGNAGNDRVGGGKGHDVVDGGEGADVVTGGVGDDTVTGGVGDDIVSGGLGADEFVFYGGADTFTDFDISEDILSFASTPWGSGTLSGTQIVDIYGESVAGGYELAFNAADVIFFDGMTDSTGLSDVIFSYS